MKWEKNGIKQENVNKMGKYINEMGKKGNKMGKEWDETEKKE